MSPLIGSLSQYLRFVAGNRRFLGFGFLMAFSSSFGQTYFIGVFGPEIQAEFGLSHTRWGAIYMLGTLASALLLPWSGKLIDRLDLRPYTAVVCALLVLACAGAAAVAGPLSLVAAVFLLRQSGQGLASHISITSMARYFDAGRGRAIALASLGFAAGEAVLPFLAVMTVATLGWRGSFAAAAWVLLLVLIPALFWLMRGHSRRHREHLARLDGERSGKQLRKRSWTRAEVVRDTRFYLLLPAVLAPAMIVTALFFHHLNLADAKGWSHLWITGSYVVYASATMLSSLVSGALVDRFGAARLVPVMLAPMLISLVLVAWFDGAAVVLPYLTLLGLSIGISHTAIAAMWAELYGVAHLGAIKSLATAMSVFASALGPVVLGALMDQGFSIESGCLVFSLYTFLALASAVIGLRHRLEKIA